MITLIVAETYEQARFWADNHGALDWRFVADVDDVLGYRLGPDVELVTYGNKRTPRQEEALAHLAKQEAQ